jgi:hypothetical protein
MYQLGLRKLTRANEELLSDATPEQLQALLSLYMQMANEPLPEDEDAVTEVQVKALKPMASLAAQTLTRILSRRNFGGTDEPDSVQP